MKPIILINRSLIISGDVSFEKLPELLRATYDLSHVGGYKVPALAGRVGWERWIEEIRKYTTKPILYDHQKLGTDTPHTAKPMIKELKAAGFDAVFLYPLSGPDTQSALIQAAKEEELGVIVGGLMTHDHYLRSEQGFIADEAVLEIYTKALELGITNFGVPSNKLREVKIIRETLESQGVEPIFYFIGLGPQGGSLPLPKEVTGEKWHVIVGRDIHSSSSPRQSALEYIVKIEKN